MTKRNRWKEAAVRWLNRNTPFGYPWKGTLTMVGWSGIIAFLGSLTFFVAYSDAYERMRDVYIRNEWVLREGATMVPFVELLGNRLMSFHVLSLAMIGLAAIHYSYHYQGSKSIYLMKRLPDRWDLWRRCFTLPVVLALASEAAAVVMRVFCFAIYMMITPEEALIPGQWIW